MSGNYQVQDSPGLVVIVLIKEIRKSHFADDCLRAIPKFEKYLFIYLFLCTSDQFNLSTEDFHRTISMPGYCPINIKGGVCIKTVLSFNLWGRFMLSYARIWWVKKHGEQITNRKHINFLTHESECNQVQKQEEYFLHENRSDYISKYR